MASEENIKLLKFLKALDNPIRIKIVEFILNERAKTIREEIIERDRELLENLNTGSKKIRSSNRRAR